MKALRKISIAMCCLFAPLAITFGQITTNGTGGGAWSSTATWAGGVVPNGSGIIDILPTDSVIYDTPVTISSTLTKYSSKKDSMGASGSVTFANGGTYLHSVNSGSIPVATWQAGSTCTVTGITSTVPSNSSQNFYNFNWICPQMSQNMNLGWHDITIGGAVVFRGAMPATNRQLRLTSDVYGRNYLAPIDTFNVITINGPVVLSDTVDLTATGSGTYMHGVRVIVGGYFDCTLGTPTSAMFQLGNGSGAAASWWMKGNAIFSACTLNTNSTYQDTLVFCGTQGQILSNSDNIPFTKMAVEVYPGSVLYMPDGSSFGNATNDFFRLDSAANFVCGSPLGLAGNITTPLANTTLSTSASYFFIGSAPQVTSTLMPATVNDLQIDNASGLFLSRATTVNGLLYLSNGVLDNCTNNITVLPGNIVTGSGSLACTPVGVEKDARGIPGVFHLSRNFPNPFNPTTELRFSVPVNGMTTLKVYNILGQNVATLFNGIAKAGENVSVKFNAANLPSGVYYARLQQDEKNMIQQMVLIK